MSSTAIPVEERTGFIDEEEANDFANILRDGGQRVDLIKEGKTWTLRIFPEEYGKEGPPPNPGVPTTGISPGTPITPVPRQGGVRILLDYIAALESNKNYNAFYGNPGNCNDPSFTDMSLAQVIEWQENRKFSAAGRYQIIQKTLKGLIKSMGLDASRTKFDPATQDLMAIKLLEDKGLSDFLARKKSAEDFANSVARVWAALPIVSENVRKGDEKIPKGASYYHNDGVNKALAGAESYLRAVETVIA